MAFLVYVIYLFSYKCQSPTQRVILSHIQLNIVTKPSETPNLLSRFKVFGKDWQTVSETRRFVAMYKMTEIVFFGFFSTLKNVNLF